MRALDHRLGEGEEDGGRLPDRPAYRLRMRGLRLLHAVEEGSEARTPEIEQVEEEELPLYVRPAMGDEDLGAVRVRRAPGTAKCVLALIAR